MHPANSFLASAFVALALSACSSTPPAPRDSATSPASVEYIHAEKFTDLGRDGHPTDRERAFYLEDLRRDIGMTAQRVLSPGQRLAVRITDIDMAGGFEPWRRRASDVRIVRDIYPPRIDLQFQLTNADGSVLRQGERKLRNAAFLMSPSLSRDSDALYFEKALLREWMQAEFR